jgi:hypothetical protein
MLLSQFKATLNRLPAATLRIVLPDGDTIPDDFHITEVGYVTKRFVDCGGTVRSTGACVLQAWVARNDKEHRLSAGKLASILELARDLVPSDDAEMEIEYEGCLISQFPVLAAEASGGVISFSLGRKHTDCLAREACGLEACGCESEEGQCC